MQENRNKNPWEKIDCVFFFDFFLLCIKIECFSQEKKKNNAIHSFFLFSPFNIFFFDAILCFLVMKKKKGNNELTPKSERYFRITEREREREIKFSVLSFLEEFFDDFDNGCTK